MYFKFPYSDMYALNLDWMIKAIKEVQEIIGELGVVVNSVNGESGDVTISAEMVNATSINGTLVTTTDPSTQPQSVLEAYYGNGIRVVLVRNNLDVIDRCFFLSKNDSVYNLAEYVPGDPQSGVRFINGLSGDVTLTGENIMLSASDQQTIAAVIAALNTRIGNVESVVGDLSELDTYNKSSVVAAINELVQTDNTIFEDIGDVSELDVDAGNVVAAVNTTNNKIVKLGSGETYSFAGTVAPVNIPANTFFYQNGILSYTKALITQGATIPNGLEVTNGGLNKVFEHSVYTTSAGLICMKFGLLKIVSGAPLISGSAEWIAIEQLPGEYMPIGNNTIFFSAGTYNKAAYAGRLTAAGLIQIYTPDTLNAQVFINCAYL